MIDFQTLSNAVALGVYSVIPTYLCLKVIFLVVGLTGRIKAAYELEPFARKMRFAAANSITRNYALYCADPWMAHEYIGAFIKAEQKVKQ